MYGTKIMNTSWIRNTILYYTRIEELEGINRFFLTQKPMQRTLNYMLNYKPLATIIIKSFFLYPVWLSLYSGTKWVLMHIIILILTLCFK